MCQFKKWNPRDGTLCIKRHNEVQFKVKLKPILLIFCKVLRTGILFSFHNPSPIHFYPCATTNATKNRSNILFEYLVCVIHCSTHLIVITSLSPPPSYKKRSLEQLNNMPNVTQGLGCEPRQCDPSSSTIPQLSFCSRHKTHKYPFEGLN